MELMTLQFKVEREKNNERVKFVIPDLENIAIDITNDSSEDIEKLFNMIFYEVINNEKLIEFQLDDTENDLFNEVASDIVIQLNNEIKKSESDFIKLIELDKN